MRFALALPVALWLAAPVAAETDLATLVVPPDGIVDGQPLTTYADRWWQWAYAMPQSESPIVDEVGTFCHVGQSGSTDKPLIFLRPTQLPSVDAGVRPPAPPPSPRTRPTGSCSPQASR